MGHRPPILDQRQDWTLLYANEQNGKMTVKVVRKISASDSGDIAITVSNVSYCSVG